VDQIERFISDENIVRFVEQIRTATGPDRQHMLRRLLIEEERRFGATEERLGMVSASSQRAQLTLPGLPTSSPK